MIKLKKRLLACVLAAATTLTSLMPGTVMAEGEHIHSYKVTDTVAPTCEERGYTVYTCTGCEDSYLDDYVDPKKHSYYAVDTGKGTHRMVCRNDDSHNYEEAHEWSYQNKILPTCTEEGYSVYVCGKCGATQNRDFVPSTNHDYVWHDNENGSHTGICANNKNHTVTEYCREFYHDTVTPPTCTEKGYTTHICERCGGVLVDTYTNPLTHSFTYRDNGDGTHTGVCKRDANHVETKAHTMEQSVVAPTCTERGYTHNECTDCGYSFNDNFLPPVTHKWAYTSNSNGTHTMICEFNNAHSRVENCEYESKTVAPTCDNQGYDLHTCKHCGYSYKDNFKKALGHDYVWTYNDNGTHTGICKNNRNEVVTEPCDEETEVIKETCTTDGYTKHTCKVCKNSYKDSYVTKTGHDYEYTCLNDGTHQGICKNNSRHTIREKCNIKDIVTKPTCTTNGYTTHECSVCGYSYIDSYVPAMGHNHVYTNLGNGTHRVTCKNDPLEVSVIEDHSYTVTVVNPTCEAEGYTLHECKLCGYSYKDNIIPAKGHHYVYRPDDTVTHTATCTNDASHIIKEAHDTIDVVTAPTCTTEGYTTHTCKVCNFVYKDSVIPAKGHHYTWIIDKNAEVGVAGSKHEQCTNCGDKKAAVSIPALKSNTRLLPVISSGKTSQKLKWNAIPDAEYYKVYAADCGETVYKCVGTTKGTSFSRTKLKKGRYYKYYVVAINKDDSKEVSIEKSMSVHSTTTGRSKKNPTKITAKNTSVKLKKSASIKASVSDKKVARHVARIRYFSTNPSIATVSSSGKVTGKKKGTCYVYAIAQDGRYKKVKITVK